MDKNLIQFIICGNDPVELAENRFYFDRLYVPEGMKIQWTLVENASSMAEGYNRGMSCCDAKYRIYLHQDTMLVHPFLLHELLEIFRSDTKVGLLGVTGCGNLPQNAICHDKWDTGRVYTNSGEKELYYDASKEYALFYPVEAVDGLLLATQYDIPWREDILGGWDFYDISQAMEFKRRGYQTVVPMQKNSWCWHDNETSRLFSYERWRRIFVNEYQDIQPFQTAGGYEFNLEQDEILDEFEQEIIRLADVGDMESVSLLLEQYHSMLGSRAKLVMMENICYIRAVEKKAGILCGRYGDGLSVKQMFDKMRKDKFWLKRIDFGAETYSDRLKQELLAGEISKPAILTLIARYAVNRERIIKEC